MPARLQGRGVECRLRSPCMCVKSDLRRAIDGLISERCGIRIEAEGATTMSLRHEGLEMDIVKVLDGEPLRTMSIHCSMVVSVGDH